MSRLLREPMARSIRAAGWFAIFGMVVFQAGCLSERQLYGRMRSHRAHAYRQWRRAREQEDASKPRVKGDLSLQDALKMAMTCNKSLQATLQQREIARGKIVETYSEVLPTVSATAGYTRLDKVSTFDVGGSSVSLGDVNNYSTGLEVSQPLFRGGGIPAALRSSRWYSLLADEQVRGAVHSVIYDLTRAYYDVLLAQHLFEVNRDAVASAKAYLQDVGVKRDQGVASDFDVLRAQVDVSNFEAQMIQQRNRIHVTKTELHRVMGVSQESRTVLSDELTFAPMKPVLEEAVRLACENRPDLFQAELNVQLQEEALRVARSEYWPTVDAWFQQEWSNPDPHSSTAIEWGDAWSAGVSANWTLFDGLGREGRYRQERALLRKRAIELVDTEERAFEAVQQTMLSLRDAEEFVESQRLNLDRAREALRLAEVGYRQGITEAVQVTEARAALTRAKGLYYEAVYSHAVARLNLQQALGILGPRAGGTSDPTRVAVRPGEIEEFAGGSGRSETPADGTPAPEGEGKGVPE